MLLLHRPTHYNDYGTVLYYTVCITNRDASKFLNDRRFYISVFWLWLSLFLCFFFRILSISSRKVLTVLPFFRCRILSGILFLDLFVLAWSPKDKRSCRSGRWRPASITGFQHSIERALNFRTHSTKILTKTKFIKIWTWFWTSYQVAWIQKCSIETV